MSIITNGDFIEISGTANLTNSSGNHSHFEVKDIDVKGVNQIMIHLVNGEIQPNGSIINGNSRNLKIYVYGSLNSRYTTVPISLADLKDNSSDILYISSGFYLMKFVVFNNDNLNATIVSYKIVLKN